jgi:hypothetical protein
MMAFLKTKMMIMKRKVVCVFQKTYSESYILIKDQESYGCGNSISKEEEVSWRTIWGKIIALWGSAVFRDVSYQGTRLGKTIQVIAFVSGLFRTESAKRILIIMPKGVLENWKTEFSKWYEKNNILISYGMLNIRF